VVVEDSTAAVAADFTAAVAADFMEAVEQRFMAEEVLAVESTLRTLVDDPTPAIVAATTQGTVTTEVTAGATAGAADIGAADMVTDGAGELGLGGRIGVGDGAIRMPPITAPGITGLTLIILTRATVHRTIPMAIRILTTETTIPPRQIPTHGRSPTRTDLQEPGDHRYLEGHPTRATQTAAQRREGQFYPLTG
jgi:hypothetical protein